MGKMLGLKHMEVIRLRNNKHEVEREVETRGQKDVKEKEEKSRLGGNGSTS